MSRLARLQHELQDFILRGDAAIEGHVLGTERVPIATRLSIYRNAHRSRLIEALESNYPALAQLLGDAEFHALGTAYIREHDSDCFNIRYYGGTLPEFLATHGDYSGAPLLADLARWEWTMTEVFDAADASPIRADDLAGVLPAQWSELQLEWHPSVRRVSLAWNAPQIWKALTTDTQRPTATAGLSPAPWLLWRRDLRIFFRSLDTSEVQAIDASRSGGSFGELCVLLCQHVGEEAAPACAARLLREWIESGLLVAVKFSATQ